MKQKIKDLWDKRPSLPHPFRKKEVGDQKEAPVSSVQEYKEKISRRRVKALIRIGVLAAVLALAVIGVKLTVDRWKYSDYKVVTASEQEDTISTQYTELDENILKYSSDDVTLLNRQGDVMWNNPHQMDNPEVDTCQEACVVYDKKGTSMAVYNISGKIGDIQTGLPILKARVAKQGVVAAILEDGETTWVNVYGADGSEIVTGKTRIDSPGYPVDLSISEDGLLMAVSYLNVKENKPASYVAFYNFGNTGQNQMDNMVSAYTYADMLVPQVVYLDSSRAVAFREDGFVIYRGKQIPEEQVTVKVKDEILGTFCGDDSIGLIFRETNGDDPYRMEIYNTSGKLKYSVGLDVGFDKIVVSKDQVLLYNNHEFAVYTMKGICRYEGSLKEGSLQNLFKLSRNRYMVVTEGGIETIKLK